MFVPLGLEERRKRRIPIVSIGIAVACVVVFIMQNLAPDPTSEAYRRGIVLLIEHPYVLPPPAFEESLAPMFLSQLEEKSREVEADPNVIFKKQQELDRIALELEEAKPKSFNWKWGLVPSRGFAQFGWLTSLFIHFGFAHIFFNLLFFYVVGPALEDRWGHLPFLGFYLAGGAFAALAHFFLDPGSRTVLGGASGAIAACIGAFAFCFATQRVRMLLFLIVFWKRFRVPAWVWSAFWFVSEVSTLTDPDGFGGVAVMAHVGGWMFGFVFAFTLTAIGWDEKLASRGDEGPTARPSTVPALMVGGVVLLVSIPIVLFAMPQRVKERPAGTITISSKPPGAAIYIDGELQRGRTPQEVEAIRLRRLTRVQVALKAHRSTPLKHDVVLTTAIRARNAHFDLVRTAPITINTEPAGARVLIDGRAIGASPVTSAPIDVGHAAKLMVVLEGFLTVERNVRISADVTSIDLTLVPSRRMTFETRPDGATVLIDGKSHGRTPIEVEVPRRGRFKLVLDKPGYRKVSKRLRGRARIEISLEPLPLSQLPLDASEKRQLAALYADRKSFGREVTRLKRRLAVILRRGSGSNTVYDRLGSENEAEDVRARIEDVESQHAVTDEEIDALRRAAIERIGPPK